ncbi:unnamed protein product [Peniophora sp. CBMAI 1063]|nr:unnamed protein product [Peniophora sp. CBMAI 1063]
MSNRFTTSHNTRRFNNAISQTTRPLSYLNETQSEPHNKRSKSTSTTSGFQEPSERKAKKPRQTLNLRTHDGPSPADLARSARLQAGLAVANRKPVLDVVPEEADGWNDDAQLWTHEPIDRAEASATAVHGVNQSQARVDAIQTPSSLSGPQEFEPVEQDGLASWTGMPLPPSNSSHADSTGPEPSAPPLPRTSQGMTAADYYRIFTNENLARTRTSAILRRCRPPAPSCRRYRDLVGWWNGKFHQKAWLRDAGVAIVLCEQADLFLGKFCPSSTRHAGLPPGFDDLDPPGYCDSKAAPVELYDEADVENEFPPSTSDSWNEDADVDDEVLAGAVEQTGDEADIESRAPQVADEADASAAHGVRGSLGSRGMGTYPGRDHRGLKVMVITDVTHVHGIGVQFCQCRGAPPRDEQLLEYGIYPASSDRPATGFTLNNLDYLRMDEIECKTAPDSYTKKLRRLTNPHDWRANRYPETLRCNREYRACRALIQHGFAYQVLEQWVDPGPGDLMYRCVACPRPSGPLRNMPEHWERSPYAWGYQYTWNIDGNFEAQHTASRSTENNVYLFPGTAMFNHPEDELVVLRDAVDDAGLPDEQRRAHVECHDHKAASALGKSRNSVMDIRGIGTICCARHGCLAAGGTNDFECGESFPPVDLCLSRVWLNECDFDFIKRQLLLYDIWCRYGVNLKARFEANGYSWPEAVQLLQGIGVWHVYGHKPECNSRYSPVYAYRSGIVDGEIVETLWSLLNRILSSCRGMSLGNRRETIEAAMNDINFKKTVGMIDTLARKWKRYTKSFPKRLQTLEQLNEVTLTDDRDRWELTRRQFEALRISDPAQVDGMLDHPDNPPDMKNIKFEIIAEAGPKPDDINLAKAIIDAHDILIEKLRFQSRAKPNSLTEEDVYGLALRRGRLKKRITASNKLMSRLLPRRPGYDWSESTERDDVTGEEVDPRVGAAADGGATGPYALRANAENLAVDIPSARLRAPDVEHTPSEKVAIALELRLNTAAMDVALSDLRRGLVEQAYIFRCDIRQSASSGNVKLGYDAAKKAREHARASAALNQSYADTYRSLRQRCAELHLDKTSRLGRVAWESFCERYRPLSAKDIECNTATYDVKDHSGGLDLPWFWKLDRRPGHEADDDEYIADFFRVRWIEARSAYMRCAEELVKLQQEMDMTYLGYHARAEVWLGKAEYLRKCGAAYEGHAASAYEMENMWRSLAERAERVFLSLAPSLPKVPVNDY